MNSMFASNTYVRTEAEYRTRRARRTMVASRGQRSRSAWVRRVADAGRR